ncbi:TetR/AcrR family transcriptional regulator [Magnetovibrio sp. PR-2]|uniref:TetR/AcrR family transcriptional regulator n=1 Tax=Magnetovibrio sp. PR-2 TaxID=3120356 RepID=UPI002FCE6813
MARPQKFNTNDVLDQAMDVFWQKGYDNTSVQDLVDATGLNRGSLYNSFGDKADLFAEVLKRYRNQSPAAQLATKVDTAPPRQWIEDFLMALVDRAKSDPDHKGCLLTNTAAGLYGCDPTMTSLVDQTLKDLENMFSTVIRRGQASGHISAATSAESLARFFVTTANGMNVMASAQCDTAMLQDVVSHALSVLGDPSAIEKPTNPQTDTDGLAFPSDPPSLY